MFADVCAGVRARVFVVKLCSGDGMRALRVTSEGSFKERETGITTVDNREEVYIEFYFGKNFTDSPWWQISARYSTLN